MFCEQCLTLTAFTTASIRQHNSWLRPCSFSKYKFIFWMVREKKMKGEYMTGKTVISTSICMAMIYEFSINGNLCLIHYIYSYSSTTVSQFYFLFLLSQIDQPINIYNKLHMRWHKCENVSTKKELAEMYAHTRWWR